MNTEIRKYIANQLRELANLCELEDAKPRSVAVVKPQPSKPKTPKKNNIKTVYHEANVLSAIEARVGKNRHAIACETDRLVYEALLKIKTPIVAETVHRKNGAKQMNMKFEDKTLALISKKINGQDFAPFVNAVLKMKLGV